MGTISNRTEQIFAIGKENSWNIFSELASTRKECGNFFHLISKHHGLTARFRAPPESETIVPNRLFGAADRRTQYLGWGYPQNPGIPRLKTGADRPPERP